MRDDGGTLLVPELQCPPAAPAGPFGPEVDREVAAWGRRHGLYVTPDRQRRLIRQRFGSLAARVCPGASRESLLLYARWMCLGWFYEEEFFRPYRCGLAGSREQARGAADAAMATVSALAPGGMGPAPAAPQTRHRYRLDALTELMRDTGRTARRDQFSRLGTALVLRLSHLVSDEPPPLGPPVSPPCLVVAGIVSGCPAGAAELDSPALRRLTGLAVERASWCLRVHTVTRLRGAEELAAALPLPLRAGLDRHPQRVLDRAARLHDERARAYDRLERALRQTGDAVTLSYLEMLRGWLRALYDWSRPLATVPGAPIVRPAAHRLSTALPATPVG